MSGATPKVIIVGSAPWQQRLRNQCPATPLDAASALPDALDDGIQVLVVENAQLLNALSLRTDALSRRIYIVICDNGDPTAPYFLENAKLNYLKTASINDDILKSILIYNAQDLDHDAPELEAFVEQVQSAFEKEFFCTLRDIVCNVIESWIGQLKLQNRNDPAFLDQNAFSLHLGALKATLSDLPDLPVRPQASERRSANLRQCLYVAEKTLFFWNNRHVRLFSDDAAMKPFFRSILDDASLHGREIVNCDEGLLLIVFLAIMASAPTPSRRIVSLEATDDWITVTFPFTFTKPQGADLIVPDDFVELCQHHLPELLKQFTANFKVSTEAQAQITLRRV